MARLQTSGQELRGSGDGGVIGLWLLSLQAAAGPRAIILSLGLGTGVRAGGRLGGNLSGSWSRRLSGWDGFLSGRPSVRLGDGSQETSRLCQDSGN